MFGCLSFVVLLGFVLVVLGFLVLTPVSCLLVVVWLGLCGVRVQAVLEDQLLPGLGAHLSASEVFTPETFRDRYLSPHGSGFSIEPRILQSAYFRPHNVSEEADGLYLVGAGTHPGAGLPGVVASAAVLAQLVTDAIVQEPVMREAAE